MDSVSESLKRMPDPRKQREELDAIHIRNIATALCVDARLSRHNIAAFTKVLQLEVGPLLQAERERDELRRALQSVADADWNVSLGESHRILRNVVLGAKAALTTPTPTAAAPQRNE